MQKDLVRALHSKGAHFVRLKPDSKKSAGLWKDRPLTLDEALAEDRLGLVPASVGLAVLDVDRGDGRAFAGARGWGFVADTPSGGCHIFLDHPGGGEVGSGVWSLGGCGGEMRGDRGYVIMYDPAQVILAVNSKVPQRWPRELMPKPDDEPGVGFDGDSDPDSAERYCQTTVERLLEAEEGERHTKLYAAVRSVAGAVAGADLDEERWRGILRGAAGRIGLPDREAARVLRDAWRNGAGAPISVRKRDDVSLDTAEAVEAEQKLEALSDMLKRGGVPEKPKKRASRSDAAKASNGAGSGAQASQKPKNAPKGGKPKGGKVETDQYDDHKLALLVSGTDRDHMVYDPSLALFRTATPTTWDWQEDEDDAYLKNQLYQRAFKLAEFKGRRLKLRNATINGAAEIIKRDVFERPEWDSDPLLLGLPAGGVLDLRTGKSRPSRRNDFVSRRMAVAPDGSAPKPNRFLGLLADMTQDADTADWLLAWLGYASTGLTTVTDHATPLLIGEGGAGKDTLINALETVLGSSARRGYVSHLPQDTLVTRPGAYPPHSQWIIGAFDGPRLTVSPEIPQEASLSAAMIKEVTGGSSLTANLMRQNSRTFQPTAKVLMYGNDMPGLPGWDSGLRRRLVIIRCYAKPKHQRDETLLDKLAAEAPAIAHLLAQAARDGYARQQRGGKWLPDTPGAAAAESDLEFKMNDPHGEAIRACFEFTGDAIDELPGSLVRARLQGYYDEHGMGKVPGGQFVARRLRDEARSQKKALEYAGNRNRRPWIGIRSRS